MNSCCVVPGNLLQDLVGDDVVRVGEAASLVIFKRSHVGHLLLRNEDIIFLTGNSVGHMRRLARDVIGKV